MNNSAVWQFSIDALHAMLWGGSLLVALGVFVRYLPSRRLAVATLAATVALVMLGAYVRLSNAGLGCPDWPGCYGKISPIQAADQIKEAQSSAPAGPVSAPKAWREMVHRYLASLVGAMVLAIAVKALLARRGPATAKDRLGGIGLPIALVLVVVLQGLFGKWTVTFLLKPVIVTLHLLGGMTMVALLSWLCARHFVTAEHTGRARPLHAMAACALILLGMQIALGGWVSANYAALACVDFPTCHGVWKPPTDYLQAFHVLRDLGQTAEGGQLSNEALNAIQWSHRFGALITFLAVALLAGRAIAIRQLSKLGWLLLVLLCLQVALGITNVLAGLPLAVAVAHNAVAALLLAALVMLNFATRLSSPSNR